jgi:hypothetical protein
LDDFVDNTWQKGGEPITGAFTVISLLQLRIHSNKD